MIKHILLGWGLALSCFGACAQTAPRCQDATRGLDTLPPSATPDNWTAFHATYLQLGACDDGANGEAWSALEMKLLAMDHDNFRQVAQSAQADNAYRAFLVAHVDQDQATTVSPTTWTTFEVNMRMRCPADLASRTLCAMLLHAATNPP